MTHGDMCRCSVNTKEGHIPYLKWGWPRKAFLKEVTPQKVLKHEQGLTKNSGGGVATGERRAFLEERAVRRARRFESLFGEP